MTPGPRQTVDEIVHSTHGPCRAVYRNGFSFLILADDSIVPVRWCGTGWDHELGALLSVTGQDGTNGRHPVTRMGDTHERTWSAALGLGWLVQIPRDATDVKRARARFEGDDGRVTPFAWKGWEVIGTPARRLLSKKKQNATPETEADRKWVRYDCTDGSALVFHAGGPPPEEAPAADVAPPPEAPAQTRPGASGPQLDLFAPRDRP